MDKIAKALKKLSPKEQELVRGILVKLGNKQLENLNLKKLKGRDDIFRVRKGKLRIIYRLDQKGNIFILAIEKRSDITYNL